MTSRNWAKIWSLSGIQSLAQMVESTQHKPHMKESQTMAENKGDAFSFLGSLQAEETELPKIQRNGGSGGRARAVQDNPFVPWLQETYTSQVGKSVTVPATHALKSEYLIRQAAEDLGIGVRVILQVDGAKVAKDEVKALHPNKKVKILFQGQQKRAYAKRTRKPKNDTATAEIPAE